MQDKNFVTSLQKGLEVLTCFGRQHSRLTVSEVARLTHVSPASARRSLLTLQTMGYLDSDGKHFWMLPRCLLVAHAYLTSRATPPLAQPLLDALSEKTRESASLGTLLDDDVIVIARSTARRSLSTGLGIGSRLPVYCSAMGRVLLASLPPDEAQHRVHKMLRPQLTAQTVTDQSKILGLVALCRMDGFASSDGELESGGRSMAVPVRDRTGTAIGAMSIAVRAERMSMVEFRDAFLPALKLASSTLTARLFSL